MRFVLGSVMTADSDSSSEGPTPSQTFLLLLRLKELCFYCVFSGINIIAKSFLYLLLGLAGQNVFHPLDLFLSRLLLVRSANSSSVKHPSSIPLYKMRDERIELTGYRLSWTTESSLRHACVQQHEPFLQPP